MLTPNKYHLFWCLTNRHWGYCEVDLSKSGAVSNETRHPGSFKLSPNVWGTDFWRRSCSAHRENRLWLAIHYVQSQRLNHMQLTRLSHMVFQASGPTYAVQFPISATSWSHSATFCDPISFQHLQEGPPSSDLERALLALPARMGGRGIKIPSMQA